jgi:hypothetical protein
MLHLRCFSFHVANHKRAIAGNHPHKRGILRSELAEHGGHRATGHAKFARYVIHRRELIVWRVGAIGYPLAQGALNHHGR